MLRSPDVMRSSKDNTPTQETNWRGNVLLWDEQAIFLGLAAEASLHESPAIKVCIALDRNFFLRKANEESWTEYDSAIISPGQPHAIGGRHNRMAMLVLVPEATLAQPLIPTISRQGITRLSSRIVSNVRSIFADLERKTSLSDSSEDICRQMIEAITENEPVSNPSIDSRVAQSINWIRSGREIGVSVKEIAAGVELSESRFSHLFTENVRVPVRRYLLWLRLRDAIHLLARGGSLTETAHAAGFADSAHLTRTFRGMLGITPSALIKESSLTSFLK
ncbi:MAG: helix-turn-helix domain-containing protein [Blastocatellia bacterium]